MDDEIVVTDTVSDETSSVPHQLGKHVVGGLAAFAASKLADRAYDATLRAIRNRRSS